MIQHTGGKIEMTNKKFKRRYMQNDHEQNMSEEAIRIAKHEQFMKLAHALEPLVTASENLYRALWFTKKHTAA